MDNEQLEQLVRGISILAAQLQIQNSMTAYGKPENIDPSRVFDLASSFSDYILSGACNFSDFDK
jgi:hypothetical protein